MFSFGFIVLRSVLYSSLVHVLILRTFYRDACHIPYNRTCFVCLDLDSLETLCYSFRRYVYPSVLFQEEVMDYRNPETCQNKQLGIFLNDGKPTILLFRSVVIVIVATKTNKTFTGVSHYRIHCFI